MGWRQGGVFQPSTASWGGASPGRSARVRTPFDKGRPELTRPPGGVLAAPRPQAPSRHRPETVMNAARRTGGVGDLLEPTGTSGQRLAGCGGVPLEFRNDKHAHCCGPLGCSLSARHAPSRWLRHRGLADQTRRAANSVALNLAEGSGSIGGIRTNRYRTSLGSARESVSCLQVAERHGYIAPMPRELVLKMNRVIGTLVRVTT